MAKKTKRKGLSQTIRFEVFKRDAFKCQYCGKPAPEVTLEVDHIIPVSKGGNNDLINLITSCRDCNAGKSNRELDDQSVLARQRSQLEEINERREQIQMMAEWRKEMENLANRQIDIISEIFFRKTGYSLNAKGRANAQKVLGKYDFGFICDCVNTAFDTYLEIGEDQKFTHSSVEKAFEKWQGICKYRSEEIKDPDLHEIRHITNWFFKWVFRQNGPRARVKRSTLPRKTVHRYATAVH